MSIIGTRPPLISETNLYELHHPEYNLVEFNLNQARMVQFGEIE